MRILFVSHWSGSGGAEKALYETIEHAHRVLGVQCICVVNWRGSLYRKLRAIGVPCYVIPYRWWVGEHVPAWKRAVRTLTHAPMALAIAAVILRTRASIVYSSTFTICVGALAAFITRRPHIWHIHELVGNNTFDLGERFSTWLIARLSDRVIVVSDAVARYYGRFVSPQNIVRIHNAVLVTAGDGPDVVTQPGRLVTVGYLKETKGHEDAIRAVRVLVDRGEKVSLHVVGDTDDPAYKARLQQLVRDLAIEDCVVFTGQLRDPFPEMRVAEIVLMCARGEAFGRVTVEAMLLERPVIAASSGATPEIVEHGVNGLLYTPGAVDALADQIEALLHDRATARRIARCARERALQRYGTARYFDEWVPVVDSVSNPRR